MYYIECKKKKNNTPIVYYVANECFTLIFYTYIIYTRKSAVPWEVLMK